MSSVTVRRNDEKKVTRIPESDGEMSLSGSCRNRPRDVPGSLGTPHSLGLQTQRATVLILAVQIRVRVQRDWDRQSSDHRVKRRQSERHEAVRS
jgi:hypothetical protein